MSNKERIIYGVEGVNKYVDKRLYKRRGDLISSMRTQLGYKQFNDPKVKDKIKVKAYKLQEIYSSTLTDFEKNKKYVYTFYVRGDLYTFKARGYESAINNLLSALKVDYTLAMSRENITHIVFSNGESIPLTGLKYTKLEI